MSISTFVGTKERVKLAIDAGADHLILEDSKVAIRSFTDDFDIPNFDKIVELSRFSRELNPDIQLSANCDLLVHDRHFPTLEAFVLALKEAEIDTIRIQDQGLIPYFQGFKIHYAQEMGNHNKQSAAYYAQFCERQCLSNELTADEIRTFEGCEFEIQVQGPIMIQYSNRRYLDGQDEVLTKRAYDLEYPGREFVFHDNPHGHFMYVYFDRSLLRYLDELKSLNLASWLVDARGESDDYLKTCVHLYKTETQDYEALAAVAQRAQKAGFFRANQTDRGRKAPYADVPDDAVQIGTVVDVIREKSITLETSESVEPGTLLYISSPRKKLIELTVEKVRSVGSIFIQLPWRKGVLAKSKVYKALNQT